MRRGTKLLLLAGCAWIVVLDTPRAFAALAAGWRGPYAGRGDARNAGTAPADAPLLAIATPVGAALARR
jgi:hypothetical protein